jgi:hypothetical protein
MLASDPVPTLNQKKADLGIPRDSLKPHPALANSKVQGARLTHDLGARRRQKHHAPHGGRNELAR